MLNVSIGCAQRNERIRGTKDSGILVSMSRNRRLAADEDIKSAKIVEHFAWRTRKVVV
jgi:hypothetical protein